jgi:hypothetical protein
MRVQGVGRLGLVAAMVAAVVGGGCVGCGAESTVDTTAGPVSAVTSSNTGDGVEQIFTDLAVVTAPMPVYGLTELPAGVSVAGEWWPVVDMEDPDQYEGEPKDNPLVTGGEGSELQAQVVLDCEDGWLVILENFRGDLGDVSGDSVGVVAGRSATLYEVNGGSLVQWSDGGRWYGVFGRGVSADQVIETALELEVVEVNGAE